MKLRRLTLKNVRRYEHATISFDDGVIGIVGGNGTGKSTIVEAIGYALYGSQPTLTRSGKDDMKRSDAIDTDRWGVELEFECHGDSYIVIRDTGKTKTKVVLYKNGEIFAKDDSNVKREVIELVGMDFQSFLASVFCRQSEVARLSDMRPAERKSMVLDMLNITTIDTAITNLRRDKKSLETQLDILMDAESFAVPTDADLKSLMRQKNAIESDIEDIESRIKDIDDTSTTHGSSIKNMLNNRKALHDKRAGMETKRSSIERISTLERDIAELEKGIKDEPDVDMKIVDDIPNKEQELRDVLSTISNLETMASSKDIDNGTCPTCGQDISDEYIAELRAERESITTDIQGLEERAKAIRDWLGTAEIEKEKHEKNKHICMSNDIKRKTIASRKNELRDAKKAKFDVKKYDAIINQIEELDSNIDAITEKMDELRAISDNNRNKLTDYKVRREQIIAQINETNSAIDKGRENEKKVKELTEKVENLAVTEEVMKRFKMTLIGRVRPMLAMFTSDIVSRMTNGRYTRVDIDDNYTIELYDYGIPYPISRFSGGEQAVVNLALRLAMSQMISVQRGTEGLGFIVLDEVFGSADSSRREMIVETLTGIQNIYPQIICITHIESVIDMLQNTIHVKTVDNRSYVV